MKNVFYEQIIDNLRKGDASAIVNFKYYSRWKNFLQPGKNSIADRMPWINFPAIDFLNSQLKPEHKVFEYGGGGSTLFFLDRVTEVVTVEHSEEWFEVLKSNVLDAKKNKWSGNLVVPEKITSEGSISISNPNDYYSADENFDKMSFRNYASYIDRFPDKYFDFVLIDGRSRPSCIKHSFNKIRQGGYLILDNAERSYYLKETKGFFQNFKVVQSKYAPLPFIPTFTKTTIWNRI